MADYFRKMSMVLGDPEKFFKTVKGERSVGNAFKYTAAWGLVPTVIVGVTLTLSMYLLAFMIPFPLVGIAALAAFGGIFLTAIIYVAILAGSFISAAWFHIFVHIFGGRKGYVNTYKSIAYSMSPLFILGWIPFVNFIAVFWSFYLCIRGASIMHEMPSGHVLLAVLIGTVLASFIAIILIVILFPIGFMSLPD